MKVVDRLLASPHYGERWGRRWLETGSLRRSDGYSIDAPQAIWKYRDWVIHAVNQDMPFNEFVIEPILGDLLPHNRLQLIATGFHHQHAEQFRGRHRSWSNIGGSGRRPDGHHRFRCTRSDDRLRALSQPADPISQREFYQIYAFYNNTTEVSSEAERSDFYRPYLDVPTRKRLRRPRRIGRKPTRSTAS